MPQKLSCILMHIYNHISPIINSFKILYWSAYLHLKLSLNLLIDNVKFIIHTTLNRVYNKQGIF